VRVLLDGNVPTKLARLLLGHDARTVHQEGWSNVSNGALLDAAAGKYDVFLTLDQNLSYQQNLRDRPLAVVVLRARSNRLEHIEPLVPAILKAIPIALKGQTTIVGA
jgi:predicted nuclease of predicted toxin-antitoxin system